jgi:hypothetical protein
MRVSEKKIYLFIVTLVPQISILEGTGKESIYGEEKGVK